MLVPLSWLREFVSYEGEAQKLGDRLTMLGLELEGLINPVAALLPIVVGHVVECEKHPEAEKLSVCKVDVGEEILDIVCGAQNVRKNLKVAVVKVGSTLPDGLTIKSTKLRGMPSNGMICSEAELELSDDHDGIMELPENAGIGSRLIDCLNLETEVLDIGITPNRGDCLSILGVARETAIAFNLPLTLPKLNLLEGTLLAQDAISVSIHDANTCPMYSVRVVGNAPVSKSPAWLRYRLHSIGIRSISNHVDITNYILMELGQPLHAFDLDLIEKAQIHVRNAKPNERFITLDGQERILTPHDIAICDESRIVGLGGVMGGLNTEITEKTERVLIECANFHPSNIRKTAKRLNLHSDASYRFERGVDQGKAEYALNRAAELMAKLSGGTVYQGIVKAEPKPWKAPAISLRQKRAIDLLGVHLSTDFCEKAFKQLECGVTQTQTSTSNACVWEITPPSHRFDLEREADLIEELVRIYGVDNVPPVLPKITQPIEQTERTLSHHAFNVQVKYWGAGLGLNEAINYSFVSHKELDFFAFPKEGRISIANPLSDEMNVLRPHLTPGLLQNLRTNISQGAQGLRLFEIATSFTADPTSETTAKEAARLGILLYGNRFDSSWPQTKAEHDYQDIKGMVEHLAKHLHLPPLEWKMSTKAPWLAPCISIFCNGKEIGFAGKVKNHLTDPYHAKKPVWLTEIDLELVYTMYLEQRIQFAPLAQYPPVRRDITFIVHEEGVRAEDISQAVNKLEIPLLTNMTLIDFYEPANSAERHITYRFTFRHHERTLKDKEVDKLRDDITTSLSKVLPITV